MSKLGFKELIVWQKARALAVSVYQVAGCGALSRDYGLCDQMRRSAVSVPSNIAEGDERGSDKESVRYFCIAKGSLAELLTQLEIAREVGYLTSSEADAMSERCVEVGKMLGGLIKARRRFTVRLLLLGCSVGIGISTLPMPVLIGRL